MISISNHLAYSNFDFKIIISNLDFNSDFRSSQHYTRPTVRNCGLIIVTYSLHAVK